MSINHEQIQALKAAAEKATPGRIGDRIDGSGSIKYECVGYDGSTVLKTDHKNMEYGFVGDNGDADELFFRLCVPDFILSLLAERDADKALIAEQAKRIAELEARTLTVKLPESSIGEAGDFISHAEVVSLRDLRNLCDRAGITLVVEE